MSVLFGDPALRWLARRKLRASARNFKRRIRTLKGALFTFAGVALFLLWMVSLFVPSMGRDRPIGDPEDLRAGVRLGALVLTLLSLSSSFSHRGLFMPAGEIQRLFSAPVSRRDLIRYRLLATMGRGLFGALIVGLVVMRRMPSPGFAFLGSLCAVVSLPILNQLVAILSGGLEARWAKRIARARSPLLIVAAVGIVVLVTGSPSGDEGDGPLGHLESLQPASLLEAPVMQALTSPFRPWAEMITASTWSVFLPWLVLCLAIGLLLFEVTVRLPVDFRELSLQTSASVAARIRRVRRGGGVAASKASKRMAGFRVPWLFGRSAAGALAWRKSAGILRKAKGTLWVSVLVLVVLTVVGRKSEDALPLIAILGTFYLASGLRFDFRDDLDRMEVIKAWPVSPARVFAATLLPEVLLVSTLVLAALVVHALAVGVLSPLFWGILVLQPPFVFAWVAVDNAVFLFAPVRFVPGQEGALQNAGRGMMLMFLRALVLLVVLVICGGPAALTWFLIARFLDAPEMVLMVASAGVASFVLCLCDLVLIWIGGTFLARFDVARDRG